MHGNRLGLVLFPCIAQTPSVSQVAQDATHSKDIQSAIEATAQLMARLSRCSNLERGCTTDAQGWVQCFAERKRIFYAFGQREAHTYVRK